MTQVAVYAASQTPQLDVPANSNVPTVLLSWPGSPRPRPNEHLRRACRAVVRVVGFDGDALRSVLEIFDSSDIETRIYSGLEAFLGASLPDTRGCLLLNTGLPNPGALHMGVPFRMLGIQLPVVMTADRPDIRMAVLAMRAGAVHFLEKPFHEQELLEAVEFAISLDVERHDMEARHSEVRQRFGTLSPREHQVMALVTEGMLNKLIAYELGITEITVKVHRSSVMRKMGARTLADLVRMADMIRGQADISWSSLVAL